MAKQTVGIGSAANDGTGDPLRTAFDKVNDNFNEVYGNNFVTNAMLNDNIIDHDELADRYTARVANITANGGGEEIDWSLGAIFKVTLTANDTLNFSNYKKGQVIDMITDGQFTITLGTTSGTPAINQVGSGTYDNTTTNLIQVTCTDDDATPEFFYSVGTYSADTDPA